MKDSRVREKVLSKSFDVISYMKGFFSGKKIGAMEKEKELMPIISDALRRGSSKAGQYMANKRWKK